MLLLAIFVALLVQDTLGQSCHLRELDLCAATLLVLAKNPSNPTGSDAEIDRQCSFIRDANECRRNFTNKCATPLQHEMLDFITVGGDQFCTHGTQLREKYKTHAKCLGEARREAKGCTKDFKTAIELITEVDNDQRIALACCAFNRFQTCSSDITLKLCGPEAIEIARQLSHQVTSRLPEIVCSSYQGSLCDDLLPPVGTSPKETKPTNLIAKVFSAYIGGI